jgi:hypothetical protein
MIFYEPDNKRPVLNNSFNVFEIQWPDVAEATLKNKASIVFGAVSESRGDGLPGQRCPRFQKRCVHCFRGRNP